ncbi:MAG TPA: hypothetical protein PLR30_09630 [Saprospiraceae bacterium]|nr:hypothetical protein [Saprospiraceae bacterium]
MNISASRDWFPAKVILFGEHTVVYGGKALSIPTHQYGGRWQQGADQPSGTDLFSFITYLENINTSLSRPLDIRRLSTELTDGWAFSSNIPIGYGLGSSGAYCAAIYHRYSDAQELSLSEMKSDLAQIESYFHGSSSGLDPLVSLLNCGILSGQGDLQLIENIPEIEQGFKLIDTGRPRDGQAMIKWFASQWEQYDFRRQIESNYLPLVNHCIDAFLASDTVALNDAFRDLSYFQLIHFNYLIPIPFIRSWEDALMQNTGYYKICGAGGGGYLLRYYV